MSDSVYTKECVYNFIEKNKTPISKPQRYMSKFRSSVIQESKSNKASRRTMGPAKVELQPPKNFLKKHSKQPKLPGTAGSSKNPRKDRMITALKPRVPARTDKPLMGLWTSRNFVKTVECGVPKTPEPISVDNHKGHKQHLEKAGLVPKYIKKKNFGEIPQYLLQRNDEERRAREEYEDFVREQKEKEAAKYLSDEDKQAILKGLNTNRDTLIREYHGLPLVIDTLSKKARKERLEQAINDLEKKIDLFQRFKTLYITD